MTDEDEAVLELPPEAVRVPPEAVRELPDPRERPTLPLWPDTGTWLGISRQSAYDAAHRGEIPTLRIGRRLLVPTAALRRMLLIDPEPQPDAPAATLTGTP